MATMEDRVRTTLRERVEDVTTEPALYRRVHERADRFRRRRLLRLVPAGAAALGLAVAVPLLLQGGPEVPRIEDLATQLPVSATSPERVVTVDASGAVSLIDLADGTTERAFGSIDLGGALPTLAVAPSDRSRFPAVVLGTPQETSAGTFLRHHRFSDESLTTTEYAPGDDDGSAPWFDGGFVLSPDGRWLATFTQAVEGDGYLTLQVRPTDDRASTAEEPEMHLHERTSFPPGSVLQDWTGSLAASGGLSQVTVLLPNGQVVGVPLLHSGDEAYDERRIAPEVYGRSTFKAVAPENSDFPVGRREVAAYASSHLSDDVDGGTAYVLTAGGSGTVVEAVDGERVLGQVDVTDLIGDQEPSVVALDAWGDAATLATRESSWLLTHDGDGRFAEPLALPEGTVRAAPVGRDVAAFDVVPAAGEPEHALFVLADGTLVADDLETGERTTLHAPLHAGSGVHSLTVSVGATVDDFTAAAYDDGVGPLGVVTYVRRDGGDVVASFTAGEDLPGFASNRGSYTIAPDGRWLAYGGVVDDTRYAIHLLPIDPVTAELLTDDVRILEGGDVRPSDWSGAVARPGDRSRLAGSTPSGGLGEVELERTEDGFTAVGESALLADGRPEDVEGRVAFTSQRPGGDDDPRFDLLLPTSGSADGDASDTVVLRYLSGDAVLAERKVAIGGVTAVGNLSFAARGATALVVAEVFGPSIDGGTGRRVLLVRAEPSEDGDVAMPVPTVWSDGPVAGALLGGVAGERPRS